MSLQQALAFIGQWRGERAAAAPQAAAAPDTLEDLLRLAQERGFDFTLSELRAAHKLDWEMRYARFSK